MEALLSEQDLRARILCSSRTGNTRKVAEYLGTKFSLPVFDARSVLADYKAGSKDGRLGSEGDAAGPDSDILLLGFWAWRGGPNPTMREIMAALRGRRVFVFGTMAAWPDSPHAADCLACTEKLLAGGDNILLGHFFCQGKLDPRVRAKSRHPLTAERLRRLEEAEKHPDAADLDAALMAIQAALSPFFS
ncbi:MAG: flavodoxin [Mailhella sp.]|nr:flavodoxin [Mailhella sp.]